MPRTYRMEWEQWDTKEPQPRPVSHAAMAEANADSPDLLADLLRLRRGESLREGGGAAPIVTITCIEEG